MEHSLSEHQVLIALIALALILVLARGMAELARRVGQPEVLGELFAGFVLGPSVFGALLPHLHAAIFEEPSVSYALSGMSWIGVMLLLLLAGIEVDLAILRQVARPGIFAAALAIIPSLIAGSLFAANVLGQVLPAGFFLGIVLSVTGVSVAAKILIERNQMRRRYAQAIVAAGVASEILVWLFVAVVSAFHSASPLLAGALHALYAIGFFAVMMTVGRRFVFWAMRRMGDIGQIAKGRLTLVLMLTFAAGAVTHALGLHALLGAFVVGVLLSQAPRTQEKLRDDLQAFTVSFFGPIFFVLAGMRVDVLKLGSISAIATVALLLVVASVVKIGLSALGARIGGLGTWESALVGVGLNLKGGTDVVVAVIGTELGLLSARGYTMYAVVAILTVFFSPVLIRLLESKSPPDREEQDRLDTEEAQRRAYLPGIERVLVPISKELLGSLAASVVEEIADSKQGQGQIFDITQLDVRRGSQKQLKSAKADEARSRLDKAGSMKTVELTQQSVTEEEIVENIVTASSGYDLIAIGASPPKANGMLTLGPLADRVIDEADADVLVAIDHQSEHFDCSLVRRILVPTNGLEPSMAAGDIAGALSGSCGAEIVLFHVAHPTGAGDEQTVASATGHLDELAFRLGRLGVRVEKRVEVAPDAGECVKAELQNGYDLIVVGGVDRGHDGRVYLGTTLQTVLSGIHTPAILLVMHTQISAA